MATTTNYGWTTPDDTALVKDGAAAIRTLGSSVDTTTKNLNPETTLGDLAYRSSTANVKTRLGLGTAGQVLQVNSGANAPEWATPSSGGMTLLSTTTLTGASVTISSIPATYKSLKLYVFNTTSTTDLTNFSLRFNADTGSNYQTAIYGIEDTSYAVQYNAAPSTSIRLGKTGRHQDYRAGFGQYEIPEYASTSLYKQICGQTGSQNFSYTYRLAQVATWNSTSAITDITILTTDTAGTFNSGTVLLYGVK
jgi:hypothetical protein